MSQSEDPVAQASALVVLCTCPDLAVAERLARSAVAAGLAACVNIVPAVRSVYAWRGTIETDDEVLLVAKSTPAAFERLSRLWQESHPYELPEVIAVPVSTGSEAYLAWISDSVTP